MDKDLTTEFLDKEGYRLVWTLLGEKDIRGNWTERRIGRSDGIKRVYENEGWPAFR